METVLDKKLSDIATYKRANSMLLNNPDFEVIHDGVFGANSFRFQDIEVKQNSVPFGRFWRPTFWEIYKNGKLIYSGKYKYAIGLLYKRLNLL